MMETIEIKEVGIEVYLDGTGGGSISGSLKEECLFCGQEECYHSCDESQYATGAGAESEDEVESRKLYNTSIDALESIVLAHACAGVDVESPEYVEGIVTSIQAFAKQYE